MGAGFQFIHWESYSLDGVTQNKTDKKTGKVGKVKKRSAIEIIEETIRQEGSCPHVENPQAPFLIGDPNQLLADLQEYLENSKDAKGRKMRKDGHCLLAGVISFPREREADFEGFFKECQTYLKEKYGDRLKMIATHQDEAHPHLHFYVVPKIGEKFEDIHSGYKAKKEAKKKWEAENSKDKKGCLGAQNLAYIGAMREEQREFFEKVGANWGLARIGPGRRRLSREEWKAEQENNLAQATQQKQLADTKKIAKKGFAKGYSEGLAKGLEKAKELGNTFGNLWKGVLGSLHKPTAEAEKKLEAQQKKQEEQKKKQEAEHQAELSSLEQQLVREKEKRERAERTLRNTEKDLEKAEEKLVEFLPTYTPKAPKLDKK